MSNESEEEDKIVPNSEKNKVRIEGIWMKKEQKHKHKKIEKINGK